MPPSRNGGSGPSMARLLGILRAWAMGPGRRTLSTLALSTTRRIQSNITPRRLLSFPHLLVAVWLVIILWGERWIFDSKVNDCSWASWEQWPKGAHPHHLILVADPQIIDPHSYPSQPWPLSSLVMLITDDYMRRGYGALNRRLLPDSIFFLGDLFDGGREWKTRQGHFVDPKWGRQRPSDEAALLNKWHDKYGEDYWLQEYERFGDIFFKPFASSAQPPAPWQRGRKLVASLPGNHDLGFGAQIQQPVRDRFSAFFGEPNRVDIIGNHSIVSIDAVSLSASASEFKSSHDLRPLYEPVHDFLKDVKSTKHRAVQEELAAWHQGEDLRYSQRVEELVGADTSDFPLRSSGTPTADFPTLLLTHVPLYRKPGTPCGPRREHWPPQKPPSGQDGGPVNPDEPNSIKVAGGYQYQNVLSEEDSVRVIQDVGNVVHVFSGDDHDYCELTHSDSKNNAREITVKSISMAMGIPTPGFLLVSLYNPVDEHGEPLPGSPSTTVQTHLCLLPNQIHTYMTYVLFAVVSVVLLAIRAALVPALRLEPFALDGGQSSAAGQGYGAMLPVYYKDKVEPPQETASLKQTTLSSGTSSQHMPTRLAATASRGRSASILSNGSSGSGGNGGYGYSNGGGSATSASSRWQSRKSRGSSQRWGWSGTSSYGRREPRITLNEEYYDGGKSWRAHGGDAGTERVSSRAALRMSGRELWTTTWRVMWMAGLFWIYLAREG